MSLLGALVESEVGDSTGKCYLCSGISVKPAPFEILLFMYTHFPDICRGRWHRFVALLLLFVVSAALSVRLTARSVAELPNPQRTNIATWVSNPDGVLSQQTVASLNRKLEDLHVATTVPMFVVAVDKLPDGTDIDSYATDIFDTWGIGDKRTHNGVLLVVSRGDRRYSIRTGRGVVGQHLPDVTTARIAREVMVPALLNNDYDGAVSGAVDQMTAILTAPDVAADLKAQAAKAKAADELTVMDIVIFYLWCVVALTIAILAVVLWRVRSTRGLERHERYRRLQSTVRIVFALSWLALGVPLLIYYPFRRWWLHLREGSHFCPNCGTEMGRVDEEHDNDFLTPAQDMEEKLDSVDYDVWLCPNCGETDIYPFVNSDMPLHECEQCHARTAKFTRDRILVRPTTQREGAGVHEYTCLNCHHITRHPFRIAREASAMPVIIPGGFGGRGGGGGFGGGFGGGGLGGGSTGGGGTSGGW